MKQKKYRPKPRPLPSFGHLLHLEKEKGNSNLGDVKSGLRNDT
jgi:hypothetical protein